LKEKQQRPVKAAIKQVLLYWLFATNVTKFNLLLDHKSKEAISIAREL
jgi:hypothetical protein